MNDTQPEIAKLRVQLRAANEQRQRTVDGWHAEAESLRRDSIEYRAMCDRIWELVKPRDGLPCDVILAEAYAAANQRADALAKKLSDQEMCVLVPIEVHDAAQSELARVSAERDAANDALRSARTELGDEDGPFLCEQIKRIKAERDTLREQVAHFKSGRVWNIANEELDKLREQVRMLRESIIMMQGCRNLPDEITAIAERAIAVTSPTAAQTKEGV